MRLLALLPMVLLLAVAPCRSQDPARWIADLGDAERGEAAEIALVAIGERAAPVLIDVLKQPNDDARVRRARQGAALRVLALLGPDAAAVGGELAAIVPDQDLTIEWLDARAALEPWAGARNNLVHLRSQMRDRSLPVTIAATWRMQARQVPGTSDTAQLLERLAANEIFAREVVADLLGRGGDVAAVGPLCEALRARDAQPAGADAMCHNGFAVPAQDRFRFAAAQAVLRLRPDDPRAAIAWSGRALLHPHRTVRRAALAALARFAPDIDDCVPDLLAIARGDDAGLAVEAIKLLGMARSGGAAVVGDLEQLAAGSGEAAPRCKAVVARLHAAGVVAAPKPAPAAPADVDLRAAVAALTARTDAERWNTVVAGGVAALPLLLERLRAEHDKVPDAVVLAIGRIGSAGPPAERDDLRLKVEGRHGDRWLTPAVGVFRMGSGDVAGDADFCA